MRRRQARKEAPGLGRKAKGMGRIISIADCRFEFYVPEADQAPTQVLFLDPTAEHGVRVAGAKK